MGSNNYDYTTEYVLQSMRESDSSPDALLKKESDSLSGLATLDPQLAFLFLKLVFTGKLKQFLRLAMFS